MRNFLLAFLCFGLLSAEKCNNSPNHKVVVNLTKTEAYCGGAEPPEELLVELNTPTTYTGGSVYIFNDLKDCVDSITSSDSIHLLALKQGHYTAHLVAKLVELESITSEDDQCAAAFAQRILSMFEIKGDTSMSVNLHFGCNPCQPPPP